MADDLPGIQAMTSPQSLATSERGRSRTDMVVAVAAIAVSVISLVVAVGQSRTEERMVAASSWPFLTFETEKSGLDAGGWSIYLRVRNSGAGPARIKWFRMNLDGRPIRSRADLMARCCGVRDAPTDALARAGMVSQNDPVRIVPAHDAVDVITWRALAGNGETIVRLDAVRDRLRAQACYCSVLGECWTSELTPISEPRAEASCQEIPDAYSS